jgi:hypothetical protein
MRPDRRFVLESFPWMRDSIGLYLFEYPHSELFGPTSTKAFTAAPVTTVEVDEAAALPPAMVTLTGAEAQNLMDELWKVGIRPTEGTGSAGSLAATQRHLDDMRRIAFHALNVPEGEKK